MGAILLNLQTREWIDMNGCMKPHKRFLHVELCRVAKRYGDKFGMTRILNGNSGGRQKDFYDKLYERNYRKSLMYGECVTFELVTDIIANNITPLDSVLDIGCGRGIYAPHITSKGAIYIGIDISRTALVNVGKKSAPHRTSFIVASAEYLPFRECIFDICFHTQLLEHVQKPHMVVKESARVLRKGGKIVADVPCANKGNYEYLETLIFLRTADKRWTGDGFPVFYIDMLSRGHLQRFTKSQIFQMHAKNQIVISRTYYYVHWFFPMIDRLRYILPQKIFKHDKCARLLQEIMKLDLVLKDLPTGSGMCFVGVKE